MFNKPQNKKEISSHDFIRTPLRLMAIFQLCLAFYLICANFGGSFLEKSFQSKKLFLLYQSINHDQILPEIKEKLAKKYEIVQSLSKIHHVKTHPLEMSWIVLSISISIMLLKKNPAALQAIWLLPLITVFYITDNIYFGMDYTSTKEDALFPPENHILTKPLPTGFLNQQVQLQNDWNRYLIKVWGKPNLDKENFLVEENLKEAKTAFNIARLEAYMDDQIDAKISMKTYRKSLFILFFYFLWNLVFAIAANSNKNKRNMFKLIPY